MRRLSRWALLALVFVMPWENLVTVPGVGALSRAVGISSFLLYAMTAMLRSKIRRPHRFHVLALSFMAWGAVTAIWSPDPIQATTRVATNAQIILMLWMLWDLVREPEHHAQVLQAYVLGAFISVVATVVSFRADASVATGRYVAEGFDPNHLGIILVLAIPFSLRLASHESSAFLKLLNGVYPVVACMAVLLTGSRAAVIAMAVVLAGALYSLRYSGWIAKSIALASCAAMAWIAFTFVPSDTWDRLLSTKQEIFGGSFSNRSDIWQSGLNIFAAHPLFGTGIGGFAETLGRLTTDAMVAHNTFLSVLAEQGLLGFCLLFAVLVSTGVSIRGLRKPDRLTYLLALAALFAAFATLTFEHKKVTWFVLALIPVAASAPLEKRSRAKPAAIRTNVAVASPIGQGQELEHSIAGAPSVVR